MPNPLFRRTRVPRGTRALLSTILVASVAVVGLAPRSGSAAATRPSGPLVPAQGALFGTWITRGGGSYAENTAALATREAQLGRRFDISHHFYSFTRTFPTQFEQDDKAAGRIPMISWNGGDTLDVLAGRHDAWIDARADAVEALGVPVFLRYFWEPEAKASTAHSYQNYIAAWRYVRSRWLARGADNAVWVWCPTAWHFTTGEAQKYYPGDDAVDWVCADGYNWAPGRAGDEWQMWNWIYQPAHDFALARGKPLMAGEWGVQERNSGEKAAWMTNAAAAVKNLPALAAVVTFDENRIYDWRVDSTSQSLAAFVAWANDPYFTRTGSPPTTTPGTTPHATTPPATTPRTPPAAPPAAKPPRLFASGFESGTLRAFERRAGLRIERRARGANGDYSAKGDTHSGRTYARAELASPTRLAWARMRVKFDRLPNKSMCVIVFRDANHRMISAVMIRPNGDLVLRDNVSTTYRVVEGAVRRGRWYTLALRTKTDGGAGLWLNGVRIAILRADFGRRPVTEFEIGDSRSVRRMSYAVRFDSIMVDDTALA